MRVPRDSGGEPKTVYRDDDRANRERGSPEKRSVRANLTETGRAGGAMASTALALRWEKFGSRRPLQIRVGERRISAE
jgi:hypothetical protein